MKKTILLLIILTGFGVWAQTPDMISVSWYDGYNGNGFVYKMANGVVQHLHDFISVDENGRFPEFGFTEFNGQFYAVTNSGGASSVGTIISYNSSTHQVNKVYDFNYQDGRFPSSPLKVYNQKFYGMTFKGGAHDLGVIYSFDPATNTYQKLYDFSEANGNTVGGFTIHNGVIYGFATKGGSHGDGLIFSFDLNSSAYQVLFNFDSGVDGAVNNFVEPVIYNNAIYGTFYSANKLFKFDLQTNNFSIVQTFDSSTGIRPTGKMVLDGNYLYGVTKYEGDNGYGSLYQFDLVTNQLSILHHFDLLRVDYGGIIKAGNRLLGIANQLTISPLGGVYGYDLSTDTFSEYFGFTTQGLQYINYLTASGNYVFGLRKYAGFNFSGEIFVGDLNTNQFQSLYNFNIAGSGSSPWGRLEVGNNGKFYGVTRGGGDYGMGVVYEIDLNGNFFVLYNLMHGANYSSNAHKVTLFNGKVYVIDRDKIVSIDLNTHQVTEEATLPSYAYTPLFPVNGKLYGVTYRSGIFFEFDPATGTVIEYPNASNDFRTFSSELSLYNNKLYTFCGYNANATNRYDGTIISFDLSTHVYIAEKVLDATTTGALRAYSSSQQALTLLNNKFYGALSKGGSNDYGTLFEFDPVSGAFNVLQDLDDYNYYGQKLLPVGAHILLGAFGDKIIAFDLQNNSQQVVQTLSPEMHNAYGSLVDISTSSINSELLSHFKVYPNPVEDVLYVNNTDKAYEIDKINIFDMTGKLHLKTSQTAQIPVNHLDSGLYILQINLTNGQSVKQLILKK